MSPTSTPRAYLLLVAVTALNMVFIIYFTNQFARLVPSEVSYSMCYTPRSSLTSSAHGIVSAYVDHDFPAQLPLRLSTVGLVIEPGYPHFSLYADDDWGTLFPKSSGFTDLGPSNRTFLVSSMHQIHCLDVFRVAFVTNRTGMAHHVQHCLHYMRQVVLCNADTTLEPAFAELHEGQWVYGANAVSSTHRCKDWTALRRYLDDHPAGPARPDASHVTSLAFPGTSG